MCLGQPGRSMLLPCCGMHGHRLATAGLQVAQAACVCVCVAHGRQERGQVGQWQIVQKAEKQTDWEHRGRNKAEQGT